MSLSEESELHDLVKQTLEKSGSMSKLRVRIPHLSHFRNHFVFQFHRIFVLQAELRASVFLALEENGCFEVSCYAQSATLNDERKITIFDHVTEFKDKKQPTSRTI